MLAESDAERYNSLMFDAHAHIGIPTDNAYVCSSKTEEAPLLAPYKYKAAGLLPPADDDISRLEEYAEMGWGIGEVGIDRRFPDKEGQIERFRTAVLIAKRHHSLLTIHAVGWTDALLSVLRDTKPERFLVHSFSSSIEVAREIISLGGVISLSPKSKRAKSFDTLIHSLPFFLTETDMPTGEEEEKVLHDFNTELSGILQRDISGDKRCRLFFEE